MTSGVHELAVDAITSQLDRIGLADLGEAALMDRVDTKFVVAAALVPELLRRCGRAYRVLEVGATRRALYSTVYFDTSDLRLYHAHHAGRAPRQKLRLRSYVDSNLHFLELKTRQNTGRTTKLRVPVVGGRQRGNLCGPSPLDHLADLPSDAVSGIDPLLFAPTVTTRFSRVTLVDRFRAERVTIDLGLRCDMADARCAYHGVAFVEVKQARRGSSPVLDALRALRVRDGAISKYCLGIVSLSPVAKKNHYKSRYAHLLQTDRVHVLRASTR